MKADRGQFRAISVVLLDGHDFRRLPERQRTLLVIARLSLGPCAIAAMPGWFHLLSDRTAIPVEAVATEWRGLQEAGWAYFDGVTAWIVRGLDFEPGLELGDWKHRVFVQRHVDGLPRSALVGAFVARYRDWWDLGGKDGAAVAAPTFAPPDAELQAWLRRHGLSAGSPSGGASKGLASPFEGHPKPLPTNDTDTDTETEHTPPRARAREAAGWNEERLRAALPARCHPDLRSVLVHSGKGADGAARAIAGMAGLDASLIPGGPGMGTCTPDEMAEVLQRLASSKDPAWHQGFVNRILTTLRREERVPGRGGAAVGALPEA